MIFYKCISPSLDYVKNFVTNSPAFGSYHAFFSLQYSFDSWRLGRPPNKCRIYGSMKRIHASKFVYIPPLLLTRINLIFLPRRRWFTTWTWTDWARRKRRLLPSIHPNKLFLGESRTLHLIIYPLWLLSIGAVLSDIYWVSEQHLRRYAFLDSAVGAVTF